MAAYFRKETAPIRALFTRDGLIQLTQNMIEVLRWGLWMSPIIKSFLRPMGDADLVQPGRRDPDRCGRSCQDVTLSPDGVPRLEPPGLHRSAGLRLGPDLDLARSHGPARGHAGEPELPRHGPARPPARAVPGTGGDRPLHSRRPSSGSRPGRRSLIPFYIPRGQGLGLRLEPVRDAPAHGAARADCHRWRRCRGRANARPGRRGRRDVRRSSRRSDRLEERSGVALRSTWSLSNPEYEVVARRQRRGAQPDPRSRLRRQPALVRPDRPGRPGALPGRCRRVRQAAARLAGGRQLPRRARAGVAAAAQRRCALIDQRRRRGCGRRVEIRLPDAGDPAELWTITVENLSSVPRAAQGGARTWSGCSTGPMPTGGTRSTTASSPRWSTRSGLHAVLAWDKHAKALGILAADVAPEGFLTVPGRLHRPRPEPLDAARAGDPGVHRARRHRGAPDLRPDRQPAPGPDRPRAGLGRSCAS